MTNKEQIIKLSWNVNDLLSQHVAIHDDIFKTSICHAIPIPGIFKAIYFGAHLGKKIGVNHCNIYNRNSKYIIRCYSLTVS